MPAARPERHGVEAARFGVGPALALPVALREHELRVDREEVVGLGAELAADAGQLVRDVHVGPLHEPFEHVATRRHRDVERDAALVAVGHLEQVVDTVGVGRQAVGDHRPHRVAFEPLDLHDVGAEVGERCRARRHEAVLGEVDDLDARERKCHVDAAPTCGPRARTWLRLTVRASGSPPDCGSVRCRYWARTTLLP